MAGLLDFLSSLNNMLGAATYTRPQDIQAVRGLLPPSVNNAMQTAFASPAANDALGLLGGLGTMSRTGAFVGPSKLSDRFPNAGAEVGGLTVHPDIPNQSSIESSLTNPNILRGVREVPFSAFEDSGPPKFYSQSEQERTERLANDISANGYIKPLIIAEEQNNPQAGPYIVEGAHRFDALKLLGKKSFPALVVHDLNGATK